MRKTFTLIILNSIAFASFSQIYSLTGTNQSITITPQGIKSKFPISTEVSNVALGRDALRSVTIGTQNTAVGDKTLYHNTASQNSAFGSYALYANTLGFSNSACGNNALEDNTTGDENTALGSFALANNTSLSKNVAVGYYALFSQSYDGDNSAENTAIGHLALTTNNPTNGTNGRFNTALGAQTLASNTIGAKNTALGYQANYSNTTGDENVAIGYKALWGNSAGIKNVAIGNEALANTTGSGNIALGYRAGYNETGNDKLYIANDETSSPLIGGDFSAKKVGINRDMTTLGANDFRIRTETLQVGGEAFKTLGNGNWLFVSDRRLKKNIVSLNSHLMLQKLIQLQGVTYEMKDNSQQGIQYGFIAQDIREVFPDKVKENKAGYLSADYGSYDPIIIEALKALNENLESLEKTIPIKNAHYTQLNLTIDKLMRAIEVKK